MAFREQVDFVQDGESVKAATPNRPLRQIQQNVAYVNSLLALAEAGETLILRSKTLKSDVQVGMPVYFNADTQQFEKALAAVDTDASTGLLATSPSSQIWGIVAGKISATLGHILLRGVSEIDLSSAVAGSVVAGLYYLSGAEAGKLVATRPPVGIRVLQVSQPGTTTGTYEVFVNPQFVDFLESHRHVKYNLVARPAGDHTPPSVGVAHTITNADANEEGWLPADHAIFEGTAPAGAKFGYNLSASALGQIWPPIPVENSVLQIYRRLEDDPDRLPQLATVPQPSVLILNQAGIWWMTDCYDSVPWPTQLDTAVTSSLSVSACLPLQDGEVLLELWYTSSLFFSSDFGVLSIVAREGSGLRFVCPGTDDDRAVGHIEALLDLSLVEGETDLPGHLVVKSVDELAFNRGPIVESIRSISPELIVYSDQADGDDGQKFANIRLEANLDLTGTELPVILVDLRGAEEEQYQDTLAIGFKASRECAYRGRIEIPSRISLPVGTQMKVRFWVMGRTAGSIPNGIFTLTYRILPRPSAGRTTPVTLPLTDSALAMTTTTTLITANEYVEMETDLFDVSTGDQVLFTITRTAPDGYSGELHVLKQTGVLVLE